MSEPTYKVVWPLGRSTSKSVAAKPRIADLNKVTVGHLSHGGFRDPEVRPILEAALTRRYPGIKFVDHEFFGNIHGRDGHIVQAALPGKLKEAGVDAVITGIGS